MAVTSLSRKFSTALGLKRSAPTLLAHREGLFIAEIKSRFYPDVVATLE